jgi:hypothetical protein
MARSNVMICPALPVPLLLFPRLREGQNRRDARQLASHFDHSGVQSSPSVHSIPPAEGSNGALGED